MKKQCTCIYIYIYISMEVAQVIQGTSGNLLKIGLAS